MIHILWAQQFLHSYANGNLYPQWVPDVNIGCGDASFIFYSPLLLFSYLPFSMFTDRIFSLLIASAFFSIFLSGVTMYFFCRLYSSRASSLAASVAYMLVPYHLGDLYVRGALAELWSFIWIPAVCYFAARVRKNSASFFIGLAASFAGLILTHLPTALLFSPFLSAYVVFLLFRERDSKLFLSRIFALGLGVGLASFYLMPAVMEQNYVAIRYAIKFSADNFVHFSQTAADPPEYKLLQGIIMGVVLIAIAVLTSQFYSRKAYGKNLQAEGLFFVVACLTSVLLMHPIARPLWDFFHIFQKVQFPWRLLVVASFCASVSFGLCLEDVRAVFPSMSGWGKTMPALIVLFLIAVNGWYSIKVMATYDVTAVDFMRSLEKKGLVITQKSSFDEMLKSYSVLSGNLWLIAPPEYRPVWSLRQAGDSSKTGLPNEKTPGELQNILIQKINKSLDADFSAERIAYTESRDSYLIVPFSPMEAPSLRCCDAAIVLPMKLWDKWVFPASGDIRVSVKEWDPETRIIHVQASTPGKLIVKLFYYPRWKAYIHNQSIEVTPDAATGLLSVAVPQGEYDLTLKFEKGIWRSFGESVTLGCAAVLLLLALCKKKGAGGLPFCRCRHGRRWFPS